MKKILSVIMLSLLLQSQIYAATIPEGTMVVVQPQKGIDADNVKTGDRVNFAVIHPVKVNNEVVIKSGREVTAEVVKKKNNGILGIPGELELGNFEMVASNNDIIRLRGTVVDKGEGRYWANVGWFFLFPILFVKGDDGKIPVNSTHRLYTVEDINL